MEKLELKHLAPYLPYGLKFRQRVRKNTLPPSYYYKTRLMTSQNIDWLTKSEIQTPILRPLSDLTKDTEFRLDRVIYKCTGDEFEYNRYKKSTNEIVLNAPNGSAYYYSLCFEDLNCISYTFIVNLISLHFDVFGLIEKGLAISYNEIEK